MVIIWFIKDVCFRVKTALFLSSKVCVYALA